MITLVSEVLENIERDRIFLDSRIVRDLGADSIHVHDLAAAIEHEFHITVSHKDLMTVVTVKDLMTFLREKQGFNFK